VGVHALTRPRRRPRISTRTVAQLVVLAAALVAAAALLTAGTMMAPVRAAFLPPEFRARYMDLAIIGAAIVIVLFSLYVFAVHRWGRRFDARSELALAPAASRSVSAEAESKSSSRWLAPLAVLRPEAVSTRVIVIVIVPLVFAFWSQTVQVYRSSGVKPVRVGSVIHAAR
jgi:hypothetical protein